MRRKYIFSTSYFYQPWTWFKRFGESLVAFGFFYWVTLQEVDGVKYQWIKYTLLVLVIGYIFGRPKDELALDKKYLYILKISILPFLNYTYKYEIAEIKSIGCSGLFEGTTELFGLLDIERNKNRIEIIFNDHSSKSFDVGIYKKDIKTIISNLNILMKSKQH